MFNLIKEEFYNHHGQEIAQDYKVDFDPCSSKQVLEKVLQEVLDFESNPPTFPDWKVSVRVVNKDKLFETITSKR